VIDCGTKKVTETRKKKHTAKITTQKNQNTMTNKYLNNRQTKRRRDGSEAGS
jgi:hypothetical protein